MIIDNFGTNETPEYSQDKKNSTGSNINPEQRKSGEHIADKYGIPIEDLEFDRSVIVLDHQSVISALLNEIKQVDFREIAQLEEGGALNKKHYLIISIEEILKIAKANKWALCMNDGFIYVYNGAFWKQLSKEEVQNLLGKGAELLGVDAYDARLYSFRTELMKQFLSTAYLPKPIKSDQKVNINLLNGTFVISENSQYLKSFDRSDFLKYQLPFKYETQAEADIFQAYLDRVLPENDLQNILAEYIASVFVPNKILKLEKTMVLVGSGANGKSVMFEVVNALLGPDNVSNYSLQSLTNESGYQRAKLSDKILNYASEISPNMDSTIFKQLVSGEPVEARLPYKDPFVLTDYAKFIFNCNTLPKDVEQNEAFYRRFIILDFKVTIPEEERDPELAKKIITTELAGVFNWVLEGLYRLLKNKNFTYSDHIDRSVKDYKKQSDSVHLFLEDDEYIIDLNSSINVKNLYGNYKQYAHDYGYRSCSLKSFTDRLRNLNIQVFRKSDGNHASLKRKK